MSLPPDRLLLPGLLALLLGLAVWRDVSRHRIDNWITFPGALVALVLHGLYGGAAGLGFALGGLGLGLVALLPFHLYGGMAAGDVKLMAAAGAFLGPVDALLGAASSLLAGTLLALVVLGVNGGLREGLGHIGRQLVACGMTRVWVSAAPGTAAAHRFPYAAAIACGCLSVAAWRLLAAATGMTS
jgi:prepilin peptidase CpaA